MGRSHLCREWTLVFYLRSSFQLQVGESSKDENQVESARWQGQTGFYSHLVWGMEAQQKAPASNEKLCSDPSSNAISERRCSARLTLSKPASQNPPSCILVIHSLPQAVLTPSPEFAKLSSKLPPPRHCLHMEDFPLRIGVVVFCRFISARC